jgi:uncharacterized protein (DUF433 family)
LNLIEVQYEFDAIVRPTLYENLDFGDLDVVSRWWPNGREAKVFVDPRYNMGKPTVADGNVATSVLEQLFRTTGSMREVAEWYEIDLNVVEAAVAFESSLAA